MSVDTTTLPHPTACPTCGADPYDDDGFDYGAGEWGSDCAQTVDCTICGARWAECYTPSGYIMLRDGTIPTTETP